MCAVIFPLASPPGITCPLTCGSEVSETLAASEFRGSPRPGDALSRIGRGCHHHSIKGVDAMAYDRRAADRRYREKNRGRARPNLAQAGSWQSRHGPDYIQAFALMWDEQGGRCYLCSQDLIRDQANIDHDHSCCPPRKSCRMCRRGLACRRCNALIGQFGDDPAQIRRVADKLESRVQVVRSRIAMSVQLEMAEE
jgi:hypothetical protein